MSASPQATLRNPVGETHPVVFELIERRLGRALTVGERAIDLVGIDRAYAKAKEELTAEIEREKRRAIHDYALGYRPQLRATERMRAILMRLFRLGKLEAVAEIERRGLFPSSQYAGGDPPEIERSLDILRGRFGYIGLRIEREFVEAGFGSGITGILEREIDRRVPGARDAAGRVLSPAFSDGLADVYSKEAGLFTSWVYTAVLDGATCDVCQAHDGIEFESIDEALAVMPGFGPNPDCLGETRCRCRLVPGDAAPRDEISAPGDEPISPEALAAIHEKKLDQWPPKKGQAARRVLGRHMDTRGKHMRGDKWLEKRSELHDDVILEHFKGKVLPTGKPQAYYTAGGGASGKSSLTFNVGGRRLTLDEMKEMPDTIHIDPDAIKERLPEYQKLVEAGDVYAATAVHEESSAIAARIFTEARRRGYNVVLDTTGSSGKFVGKMRALYDAGYEVQVSMISAPTNRAIERSVRRGQRGGRYVPTPPLKEAHAGASRNHLAWRDLDWIDTWRVFDNSGTEAVLVAEKVAGRVTVYDRGAYEKILRKADELR